MDKFKVYVPDSDKIAGGWNKVATIEAEDEKDALRQAIAKYHPKAMVKKVKPTPISKGEQDGK